MGSTTPIICNGCGKALMEDEDIVTCPDCGTPQHRDCWTQGGMCVSAAKHASGFVWSAPQRQDAPQPEAPYAGQPQVAGQQTQGAAVYCRYCSCMNEPNTLFCTRCGRSLLPPQDNSWTVPPPISFSYEANIQPDELLDGVAMRDIATLVKANAPDYVGKFRSMAKRRSKLSWNWCAFLFGSLWALYRKLYAATALFFLVSALYSVATAFYTQPLLQQVTDLANPMLQGGTFNPYDPSLMNGLTDIYAKLIPIYLGNFALSALFGMFANYFYKRKLVKTVSALRQGSTDEASFYTGTLTRGGVSFASLVVGTICVFAANQVVAHLIIWIFQ